MLIITGTFDPNSQYFAFELELHLRCVTAALRILTVYGSFNCSGFLTFGLLSRLHNSLAIWTQFLVPHGLSLYQSIYAGKAKNYNNEFLIVYARDLVASVSSDQDLMSQTVSKIAAGLHIPHVISIICETDIGQRKSSDSPKVIITIATSAINILQLVR